MLIVEEGDGVDDDVEVDELDGRRLTKTWLHCGNKNMNNFGLHRFGINGKGELNGAAGTRFTRKMAVLE